MIFDQYFEKSLKEGKRSNRGEGSQYLFEVDSTDIAESFLKNNENKNKRKKYLSLKLPKLHHSDQIMIATYRNTSLSFPSSWSVEEAGQRLVRHIFNLINNSYKNILIRLIDTDVLVLLISYNGQVELNDIEIHACLINWDRYYNVKHHSRTWFWYFSCFTFLLGFHWIWYCFQFLW